MSDLGDSLQARLELTESPTRQLAEEEKWAKWKARDTPIPTGEDLMLSGMQSALGTAGDVGSFMAKAPGNLVKGLAKGGASQILQTGHDIVRMGEGVAQLLAPVPQPLQMPTKAVGTGPGSMTEPEGVIQNVAHPIAQFLTTFVPGVKALKGAGMGAKTSAALAGFASDFASDPDQGNLANLAGSLYESFSPDGQSALLDMLKTDKESPELLNRLKSGFVGGVTGLGIEGVLAGVRMLKNRGQMNRLGDLIKEAHANAMNEKGAMDWTPGAQNTSEDQAEFVTKAYASKGERGPGTQEYIDSLKAETGPRKPRLVTDYTYQGESKRATLGPNDDMVVAIGPDGKDLGYMWYTKEPDGGFSVRKVEVSKDAQRKGIATLLYEQVAAAEGHYKGSTDQTPQGKALVEQLRKTLPGIFPESKFISVLEAERKHFPELNPGEFTGKVLSPAGKTTPKVVQDNPDAWHETQDGHWLEKK